MKPVKVIDFILNQEKKWNYMSEGLEVSILKYKRPLIEATKYCKLLKKPITLGIFIPCSESGEILSEFKEFEYSVGSDEDYNNYLKNHKIAKEGVLFDNFYCKKDDDGKLCLFNKNYEYPIAFIEPTFVWGRTNEFTIEDIVEKNPRLDLFIFNENAKSQFFKAE